MERPLCRFIHESVCYLLYGALICVQDAKLDDEVI